LDLSNFLPPEFEVKPVAESFDSRFPVEVVTLQSDVTLWRLSGGVSKPLGRYFFCCMFDVSRLSKVKVKWVDASGLATPPGNLRDALNAITVPAGTKAFIGTVADNFRDEFGNALPGGNIQLFVPHVTNFPYDSYQVANPPGFTFPTSEITVLGDDRILRFRK
jgi:hypothetical protein